MKRFAFLLTACLLILPGFGIAQKTRKDAAQKPGKSTQIERPEETVSKEDDVFGPYRSSFSDAFYVLLQQQFNPYDVRPAAEDTIPKGDSGYRIHLISTSDRVLADTLFNRFRIWADSTSDLSYRIHGYFEFRSPSYRIHIGDFYFLKEANEVAARLQTFFPEAWVVRARIIQDRSPFYQRLSAQRADSTSRKGH